MITVNIIGANLQLKYGEYDMRFFKNIKSNSFMWDMYKTWEYGKMESKLMKTVYQVSTEGKPVIRLMGHKASLWLERVRQTDGKALLKILIYMHLIRLFQNI